ncbi:conserved hypothetical protein [Ricinus communis]|uniref:Uncharacterized protein n=1 Tax=Ricinus communis TaxID=3988 RepID=B9T6G0_RICCO|nr:conserved hypothetical protein [Ricinus communis]
MATSSMGKSLGDATDNTSSSLCWRCSSILYCHVETDLFPSINFAGHEYQGN